MPLCPPGDSFSTLGIALIALVSCVVVALLFWCEWAWFTRAGAAKAMLALVAALGVCGFILGDYLAPLIDQAMLQASGREATATLEQQYLVKRRRGSDVRVDYGFVAQLPDGGRCLVRRTGENLLEFDRLQRGPGDSVTVRYLPSQPQLARVVAPLEAVSRQIALCLVFVVILPAIFAVRRLVGELIRPKAAAGSP